MRSTLPLGRGRGQISRIADREGSFAVHAGTGAHTQERAGFFFHCARGEKVTPEIPAEGSSSAAGRTWDRAFRGRRRSGGRVEVPTRHVVYRVDKIFQVPVTSALRVRLKPDIGVTLDCVVATRRKWKRMASGKALGEFSFKAVTITYSPGPAGSVLMETNWEGTATGFGAVFGTATYVGGPKSGTFSLCWAAYLDNGDGLTGIGQGT